MRAQNTTRQTQNREHAIRRRGVRASGLGLLLLLLPLAACASMPETREPVSYAHPQAQRVARQLEMAARSGDPRLEQAQGELDALDAALNAPLQTTASEPQPAYEPAPDLSGFSPVFHGVHVASYRSRELAETGWQTYRARSEFEGRSGVVSEVDLDSGHWFRLKAGPYDNRAAAMAACAAVQQRAEWCQVTDFRGEAVAN
ncbi:SPOR domain-containing protein [Marinicauda sp. Alg238-R41]|uniref:SPOR domain-containing protein n=1 Tax=Marinicauda sp. Alg238-R41 TaxID=2993447 RepID=UPI0022E3CDD5|nr:SPOR domain-containing protein [Marinicauda sp. Alg238-R41]